MSRLAIGGIFPKATSWKPCPRRGTRAPPMLMRPRNLKGRRGSTRRPTPRSWKPCLMLSLADKVFRGAPSRHHSGFKPQRLNAFSKLPQPAEAPGRHLTPTRRCENINGFISPAIELIGAWSLPSSLQSEEKHYMVLLQASQVEFALWIDAFAPAQPESGSQTLDFSFLVSGCSTLPTWRRRRCFGPGCSGCAATSA